MYKFKYFRVLSQKGGKTRGKSIVSYQLRYDSKQFNNASCEGLDTEFFYPPQEKFEPGEAELLKRICIECPVMEACLEWAIAHERYGVWGATTPYERGVNRKGYNIMVSDPAHTV